MFDFIQAHTQEAEEGDHGGEHCTDTIPGKLLLQDLIVLSLHAGLLDQPLVVEGKRRRKSTETFAIKHEAKRPVVKVVTLLHLHKGQSVLCCPAEAFVAAIKTESSDQHSF